MVLLPDAELSASAVGALAASYGLGEPVGSSFVARGAMGAVSHLRTQRDGRGHSWTVKRSYWDHYTEEAIGAEIDFTDRCREAGVAAPRSIRQVGGGYVLSHDEDGQCSLYRVLEWVDGEAGSRDDPRSLLPIMTWLAAMHRLAMDPGDRPHDPWFTAVEYDWDDLADRVERRIPSLAAKIVARRSDLMELTALVNSVVETGQIVCHSDLDPSNVIWTAAGPCLIDWENASPLVAHQDLGGLVRSLDPHGREAYEAYRRAGGPAELTQPSHFATSLAVHLNFLGCQVDLLLDDTHPEQHGFARTSAEGAIHGLPDLPSIEKLIKELGTVS